MFQEIVFGRVDPSISNDGADHVQTFRKTLVFGKYLNRDGFAGFCPGLVLAPLVRSGEERTMAVRVVEAERGVRSASPRAVPQMSRYTNSRLDYCGHLAAIISKATTFLPHIRTLELTSRQSAR